jgi:phosphoketolase
VKKKRKSKMSAKEEMENVHCEELAALYRRNDSMIERWAAGRGVIQHRPETQVRISEMAYQLRLRQIEGDGVNLFELLEAADQIANAAMWLVVHQTYSKNVYLDGRTLNAEDFKKNPEGHTGGALNMVPAYVGYMAMNAMTGQTRSWLMGQGHAVAAIDAVNVILGSMTPRHAERYTLDDEGLTRYVQDFYSYKIGEDGKQDSPLGSHVNAHTAGGMAEGGYLGFAELQYVHMPLPGETLVAFLSDGAFEEQRGSDWAPRWWRAEDCGLVVPIMINNGRRIDQRTTTSMQGGVAWFCEHLKLNGFDPIVFDGRDPAAYVWAIFEMEHRLRLAAEAVRLGKAHYPVPLPYGVAVAPKGAGFYGEGTPASHNLPLGANPSQDATAASRFNEGARRLWVPLPELREAIGKFQRHKNSDRPLERDHPLANRKVHLKDLPAPEYHPIPPDRLDHSSWVFSCPMEAVDQVFLNAVQANPHLRPRVGNPDEMRSNRMNRTLDALKHRVTDPEPGVAESIDGAVITVLNEEAVASAALGNKGGINLIVTYEAFGAKMFGVIRQEVIFANHCREAGRQPRWLSIPLVLTSHTYENGKNEQSHQDPGMAESMMGEVSDVSRVFFPGDYNTTAAVMHAVYQSHGQIWTLVVPKADTVPVLFSHEEASRLVREGGLRLDWAGYLPDRARLILTAVGAYQLMEVLKVSKRLKEKKIEHTVVYLLEPCRLRFPRSEGEQRHCIDDQLKAFLYPDNVSTRLFVSHTRPEVLMGILRSLWTPRTVGLGYISQGGTLNTDGMLFVNRSSWAHCLEQVARLLDLHPKELLTNGEQRVLAGKQSPGGIIFTSY